MLLVAVFDGVVGVVGAWCLVLGVGVGVSTAIEALLVVLVSALVFVALVEAFGGGVDVGVGCSSRWRAEAAGQTKMTLSLLEVRGGVGVEF